MEQINPLDVLNKIHKPIETGLGANDRMPFGKHKDELIFNMINENVSYINWCLENVGSFKLSNEMFEMYEAEWERYLINREEHNRSFSDEYGYSESDLPF